jgi:hypothetical protein
MPGMWSYEAITASIAYNYVVQFRVQTLLWLDPNSIGKQDQRSASRQGTRVEFYVVAL